MKRTAVSALCFVSMCLVFALPVSADPRMETNNHFCHFILNAGNTDNEVFLAGCDSVITVVEKEAAGTPKDAVNCSTRVATGFGSATRTLPIQASPLPPGTSKVFTSANSETPCTMVESNGRAYTSHNWKSIIKVDATGPNKAWVQVHYQVFCKEGVE